jgi:HSP20 family protein
VKRAAASGPPLVGPNVDLVREGDWLLLTASLPGVKATDFKVSIVGSRAVQIEGVIPYRHPVPAQELAIAERVYGPFSRKVDLPLPVNGQGARASFDAGLLRVILPIEQTAIAIRWQSAGGGIANG